MILYEFMGFREGVLQLPNGRKTPVSIDYVEMRSDVYPTMQISVIPGHRGHAILNDYENRERARNFSLKPLIPYGDYSSRKIEKVIFNDPATIVIWGDGSKTVVKCQEGDKYSKELGLAMCISKKYLGNKGNFNETFKKWISEDKPEDKPEELTREKMIKVLDDYCHGVHCCDCVFNDCNCNNDELDDEEVKRQYEIVIEKKEG